MCIPGLLAEKRLPPNMIIATLNGDVRNVMMSEYAPIGSFLAHLYFTDTNKETGKMTCSIDSDAQALCLISDFQNYSYLALLP